MVDLGLCRLDTALEEVKNAFEELEFFLSYLSKRLFNLLVAVIIFNQGIYKSIFQKLALQFVLVFEHSIDKHHRTLFFHNGLLILL